MAFFIWEKQAACDKLGLKFPKNNHVTVRMPLLFPNVFEGATCQCQNNDCYFNSCSRRAVFTKTYPNKDNVDIITPELNSIPEPRSNQILSRVA